MTRGLTWNTFRDHLIVEYEIPKEWRPRRAQPVRRTGRIPVPQEDRPPDDLLALQVTKRWFKEDLFSGLLRLRGMKCNSLTSYAEAFYCRKAMMV